MSKGSTEKKKKDIEEDPKWYAHYSYLLDNPEIFEIFFPGRHATNQGKGKHNDVIIIVGKKGVGKTELAKMLAFIFESVEKDDKFAVFCGVPDLYSDLEDMFDDKLVQVDLDEVDEEGDYTVPPASLFKNVFVIFDDTEKHESKEIEKMLWRLVNSIAQKGRNYKTTLVCILHQLNKGLTSNTILREMDALIVFPKFYDMNTFNSIINHIGIPKDVTEALYRLDERFILIRNSAPQYFFLGSSMIKTSSYNTIFKLAYGEPEEEEEEEKEEKEFNEVDLLKALSNAGFNEKEQDRTNESESRRSTERASKFVHKQEREPTINGI
jgi:energy-coupling factor transporter ATP-binding protein EcfA2